MIFSIQEFLSGYGLIGTICFVLLTLIIFDYDSLSSTGFYKSLPNADRIYMLMISLLSILSSVFLLVHSILNPFKTYFVGFIYFVPFFIVGIRTGYLFIVMPTEKLKGYLSKNFTFRNVKIW